MTDKYLIEWYTIIKYHNGKKKYFYYNTTTDVRRSGHMRISEARLKRLGIYDKVRENVGLTDKLCE